ncbi:MAG: thiamine pyrophosphate-dependent dehydrogenase E1 component subunit alpha [Candidatus Altiarchaeota archaeon]|nr:thiamine pyrophosphate-dependent dehydrogenase E1 component subunit alpha [Candidatus Altiarchaeota archaeon]
MVNVFVDGGSEKLLECYRLMLKIRLFEEKVSDLFEGDKIKSPTHLYIGQEAVAVGVCAALDKEDFVYGTHRSHGHYIAKGGSFNALMAELYGKKTGCSSGKGGSMHIIASEVGFMGSSGIVAGTIPIAVGSALAFSLCGGKGVSVVFFGDGATDGGALYESLNFAALMKLPVLFVCENNLYSSHLRVNERQALDNIKEKAQSFGVKSVRVDGNDVVEVYEHAKKFVGEVRLGGGPRFIEALTFRYRGHVGPSRDLDKGIRDATEVRAWESKCPIKNLEDFLVGDGVLSKDEVDEIRRSIAKEIDASVRLAESCGFPGEDELYEDVFKK